MCSFVPALGLLVSGNINIYIYIYRIVPNRRALPNRRPSPFLYVKQSINIKHVFE